MDIKYYLAIDIGASSGRHIVGWHKDGELHTREVHRFTNEVIPAGGHLTWDIERLFAEVKLGIRAAKSEFGSIESLSIDTWGVDWDSDHVVRDVPRSFCGDIPMEGVLPAIFPPT